MITNKRSFLLVDKFSLSAPQEMYKEQYVEYTGSARGGSGIPIYPKKNRQNTPKYPKFLQIYPKIIEALNTLYLKFKESDILNTHI